MKRLITVLLLWPFSALAFTSTPLTVTTSAQCVPANPLRNSLTIDASGASGNIGYCVGTDDGAICTPTIGAAGTTTLPPGHDFWPQGSAPKNAVCLVAASGSQPVTVREGTQ
ncbi:MAG TPA: hypothetical protein VFW56_11905 [Bradyrhizobium sp.]|nr:hypothetical protein [Bradyrhizobium sp.]